MSKNKKKCSIACNFLSGSVNGVSRQHFICFMACNWLLTVSLLHVA